MKKLNLTILFMGLIQITSFANTWNVSASGNDNNTGTIEAPFATIQKGIDTATNGDTVLIQQGAYIENVNFNGKNIVVASQFISTNDTSFISSTIIDGNQNGSVVTFNNNEDSTCCLTGLTIKNGNNGRGGGIHCSSSSPCLNNLIIDNCTAFELGGGIYISGGSPFLNSVRLKNNSKDAIQIRNGANPQLENIELFNNTGQYGICFYLANAKMNRIKITNNNFSNTILINGSSPIISNLLIDNNTSGDIFLLTNTCDAELNFATISDNTVSNILKTHESNSNLTVKNSIIWNNNNKNNSIYPGTLSMTYSNDEVGTSGTGNINTNPMFINAEIGDYHLSNYSPCIGAGSLNDTITIDLDGLARPNPNGTTPDIGAYENELSSGLHNSLIHVDALGNDNYSNGLPTNPFQSIQAAINFAEVGDTILVHPGKYVENINYNGKSIVVGSLFLITNDTSYISSTIIDGNQIGRVIEFNNGETSACLLSGLTIQNGKTIVQSGGGILISNSSPTLDHLIIKGNYSYNADGGGIWLSNSNSVISHSIFTGNRADPNGSAIGMRPASPKIENCIFDSNISNPIFIENAESKPTFINTMIINHFGCNAIYTSYSQPEFINLTIVKNGTPWQITNGSSTKIENSIIWNNISNGTVDQVSNLEINFSSIQDESVLGSNNIFSDPLFLDTINGNYRLSDHSPCIGAATSTSAPTNDIIGNPRPNPSGTNPDIGAYENTLGTPKMLFDSTICLKDTLKVVYNGIVSSNIKLSWNFPGASFVDTIDIRNARVLWDEAGYKTISLLVKDNGVTLDNQIDSVLVHSIPTSTFVTNTQKLCGSDTVLISYTGTGIPNASYNWDFDSGNIISGTGQGAYEVNWDTPGIKNINLLVEENGCASSLTLDTVRVYQPTSTFSLSDVVCENLSTTINFAGYASDSATFNWNFDSANIISGSESGPYELYWDNLGQKIIELIVDDNGCVSSQTTDTIEHNSIPTSDFTTPLIICFNSIADINYIGSATNSADYTWNFDNGSIISGADAGPYEILWDNSGLKTISLNVTENGCSADTSINLTVNQQTQPLAICIVGVDSSNHNMIVWEQPNDNPYDSIIIYKETSQSDIYERIGSQSASDITLFIDSLSNPAQNSSRYKIAVLDTCDFETAQSDYHKTMHLTVNSGIGGVWNLIWDGYEGFDYSTYNIYRGTSDNNLLNIAEQPSNTFTYTDLTPPTGTAYYQIEVVNPNPCNISNLKSTSNYYSSTRSNIVNTEQATSVNYFPEENIKIWPNPANENLVVLCNEDFVMEIYDLSGKKLIVSERKETDISYLSKGIYFVKIVDKKGVLLLKTKLVIN